MESSAARGRLFDRGVWRAPYLVAGLPALIAVDAKGVVRKHVKLRPGIDPVRAADWLEELLDRIDPPMKLQLVKDTPTVKHHGRQIDPRLLSDPRSPLAKIAYIRRLAEAAARKKPSPRLDD